jgi:type IX secretion system PorP/SprF family membrane protein
MKKVLITALSLICLAGFAQQEVMVSQYMFNGLFLNPAYAGSHPYISSSFLHRSQWVNFDGAPRTELFAIDGPIRHLNMGLGLIVVNDRIGATEQTDISGNYAYQLKLSKGKFAFGLRAGVSNYIFKGQSLTVWDANDVVFQDKRNVWIPKFGAGMYYFCDKWYAGLTVPTLLAYDPEYTFSLDVQQASFVRRHYFLNAGYVFTLTDKLKLKPSFLVKYQNGAPIQADLNMNLLFNEQFWIGGSYRSGDAITFMVEYQTNTRFRVGYAYDATTSRLKNYSAGSHEIMIGYDFGKDLLKVKTPRYF